MKLARKTLPVVIAAGMLYTGQASAHDWKGEANDAWIDGKIESSYLINTELNNFRINTDVSEGVVMLTGTVASDVHKELAGAIAENVEGVKSVDNELSVDANYKGVKESSKEFSTRFFDLTTTARLKSIYALNKQIKATDISIDTMQGKVTLEGEVSSNVERLLAEEIAMGLDSVKSVDNKLKVASS